MSNAFIDELLAHDGVTEIHVETTVTVTHQLRNTGETDESFQEIRERVISEDEFESLADEFDYRYHGTIDVLSDYHLRDRFTRRRTFSDE